MFETGLQEIVFLFLLNWQVTKRFLLNGNVMPKRVFDSGYEGSSQWGVLPHKLAKSAAIAAVRST